jgi:hypothetical protein
VGQVAPVTLPPRLLHFVKLENSQEAVTAIECIVSTFGVAGYEPEGDWQPQAMVRPVLDSSSKVSDLSVM